jgi:hypothetical protein
MTAPPEPTTLSVPETLTSIHEAALAGFVRPGSHFDGATRRAIVEESRAARDCTYCEERAAALSPASASGEHTSVTDIPANLVEAVHRLTTDSGRLTRAWFESVLESGVGAEQYVEASGLIGTSTIADTFATAIEGAPRKLAAPDGGTPSGESNDQLADVGAYVGVMDYDYPHPRFEGRPAPNICRALAMVPSAMDEFWELFTPHYSPMSAKAEHEFGRSQIEFVASRTSALNECFY